MLIAAIKPVAITGPIPKTSLSMSTPMTASEAALDSILGFSCFSSYRR